MRREPAITFRGALQILGHDDHTWLNRIDGLLGGVILASSGVPAIGALWGWVDQKNEATGLLRRAMGLVSGRLTRTGGLARHELVVAAHTTLVMAAFFETLRSSLGDELTKAEEVRFGTGSWQQHGEPLVRHLYAADVPSPSAVRGFEENVAEVDRWAATRAAVVGRFLHDSGAPASVLVTDPARVAEAVARRYRSDYLRLATTVREFTVWADLGEHAATRAALARLADLLTQSTPEPPRRDLRALVGELNRAELTRPVIDVDADGYGVDAVFPAVQDIFITPHFRATTANRETRIGDDHWWKESTEPRRDLDAVLARHFSTPGSTRLPLLLLGHPGAGKSLLTKVLAARLPEDTYTVVRVPLRGVDADANVSEQIQQALSATTHRRVSWPDLADQSADAIRVVLLDGLDELLQATTNDRAGYLTAIVEFQRVEALANRPVAVVVTSRTLVADRVRVPDGTPVLKLDDFDDDQIREWLRVWHGVNGTARSVTAEDVMAQGDLARQPLLLLMLVLYFADPDTERPPAELSTGELYGRLFDIYARREVTKQAGRVLPDDELTEAVRTQLLRLSTAALGMFNRGRQFVSEAELSGDLAAMGEPAPEGGRLLGEFFFVHAPEANAGATRGYEFLHATFGEYLVASRVTELLVDMAEGAFGRRRIHDPDDELLFALLSYQPLAIQWPILDFIAESMPDDDRDDIARTLDLLIPAYRYRRPTTRYPDYRPLPPDTVRALAAYSANLVLLRVLIARGRVPLTTMWSDGDEHSAWRGTVRLWEAGLDTEGYRAMLSEVGFIDGALARTGHLFPDMGESNEVDTARLRGDYDLERRLRLGHAVLDGESYSEPGRPHTWEDTILSDILRLVVRGSSDLMSHDRPEAVRPETISGVAPVAYGILGMYCVMWRADAVKRHLRWLMRLPTPGPPSPLPLALIGYVHPGLVDSLQAEPDDRWTTEWRSMLETATLQGFEPLDMSAVAEYLRAVVPGRWPIARPDEDPTVPS